MSDRETVEEMVDFIDGGRAAYLGIEQEARLAVGAAERLASGRLNMNDARTVLEFGILQGERESTRT